MLEFVSYPSSPAFSGNRLIFTLSATDTPRVEAEVLVAGSLELVGNSLRSVVGNVISFDLHSYVDAHLKSVRDVVSIDGTTRVAKIDSSGVYRFRFTGRDADGLYLGQVSVEVQCIRGETDVDTDYMVDYVKDFGHVLSFAPLPSVITSGGVVHFSAFNKTERALKLVGQFTYPNGSVTTTVLEDWVADVGTWHFALPWAYLQDKVADGWNQVAFWLRDAQNVAASTVRRYLVMPVSDRDRWLVFENSVGGWDSFRAIGMASEKVSYDRTLAETDSDNRVIATERRRKFNLQTGPMSGQYLDTVGVSNYLTQELGGTRSAYLLTPSKITEVRVANSDLESFVDNEFNLNLPIELEAVKVTKAFTQPAAAIPPEWTPEGEGYYEQGYIVPGYFD